MKIYTKTGDSGTTGLLGGQRVEKDHPRVHAYGEVDELCATLGLARSHLEECSLDETLESLQNQLFTVGADLATPKEVEARTPRISSEQITNLETRIDHYSEKLPPQSHFVLPGGNSVGATLHLARCVCRRAERAVWTLSRTPDHDAKDFSWVLIYLNRLSDLLFMLARYANVTDPAGIAEVFWEAPSI
jgi:cob(I)alamin adenosyltransferase